MVTERAICHNGLPHSRLDIVRARLGLKSQRRGQKRKETAKMLFFLHKRRLASYVILGALGAEFLGDPAVSQTAVSPSIAPQRVEMASDTITFGSSDEAEAYLAKALPLATAANPKYRSQGGVLTQWLTKSIAFAPSRNPNGISIAMTEEILDFRNGVQVRKGSHEAQFLIEDVRVSELTDSKDVTEGGEQARGVIFNCLTGKCVSATWDGAPSPSEWTDISIQNAETRANILSAFQALKRAASGEKL
jgi:hypothetical protein